MDADPSWHAGDPLLSHPGFQLCVQGQHKEPLPACGPAPGLLEVLHDQPGVRWLKSRKIRDEKGTIKALSIHLQEDCTHEGTLLEAGLQQQLANMQVAERR